MAAHDILEFGAEFRGLARASQPEERQGWIPPLLACGNHRHGGTDQGLVEGLWKDRDVRQPASTNQPGGVHEQSH